MTNTPAQLAKNALRQQARLELQATIKAYPQHYREEQQQLVIDQCLFALEKIHGAIVWVKAQCDQSFEPVLSTGSQSDENLVSCE